MYGNETRGLAVAVFSATVFMGPLFAPFIGGFIVDSYLGWRWTVSSPDGQFSQDDSRHTSEPFDGSDAAKIFLSDV